MSDQFVNDTGKWIVFGNKSAHYLYWICAPGYVGIVENQVEVSRHETLEEAEAACEEYSTPHPMEDSTPTASPTRDELIAALEEANHLLTEIWFNTTDGLSREKCFPLTEKLDDLLARCQEAK